MNPAVNSLLVDKLLVNCADILDYNFYRIKRDTGEPVILKSV